MNLVFFLHCKWPSPSNNPIIISSNGLSIRILDLSILVSRFGFLFFLEPKNEKKKSCYFV